ncbi:hypothetical protein FSP39_024075 [Pinctada imbricata]|uniref:Uncharacterized protein n=1 Tax=Pinctada imbricata TaxID=66713 RepID=A0AA89C4F5_PINIB|nr:hypothetical protein FSP39_024075 [Pinctada imbricata]
MDLEILSQDDDYEVMDTKRRTIQSESGEEVVLDRVTDIVDWYKNLSTLPNIEHYDVLIYLLHYCKWPEQRLKNFKNDNGYRLFLANHIDNVEISSTLREEFVYVKATCVPETRQSATPYSVWILIKHVSGEILSAGCSCVAYV